MGVNKGELNFFRDTDVATEDAGNLQNAKPKIKESSPKSIIRSILQFPLGILKRLTYPADLALLSSVASEGGEPSLEELSSLYQTSERLGIPFDESQYIKEHQKGTAEFAESFPTQENIERYLEEKTGVPFTTDQESKLQKALRLSGEAYGFTPSNFTKKLIAAATVPAVSESLQQLGTPEWISNLIGFGASQVAARDVPKKTPKSIFEKIIEETARPTGMEKKIKISKIPKKASSEELSLFRKGAISEKSGDIITKELAESKFPLLKFEEPKPVLEPKSYTETPPFSSEELDKLVVKNPETKSEFGKEIQNDIRESYKERKRKYKNLYEKSKAMSMYIPVNTKPIVNKLKNLVDQIEKFKTKVSYGQSTSNLLKDSLSDLGYTWKKTKTGSKLVKIKNKVVKNSVADIIELSKILGERANYETEIPSVKNSFKDARATLKNEARNTLEKNNETAYKYLVEADELFEKTANEFETKIISDIKDHEFPEKISKIIEQPSSVENLKKVLPEKSFKKIERELLGKISNLDYEESNKYFNEIKDYLSDDSRKIAESIIESKNLEFPQKFEKHIVEKFTKAFGKPPRDIISLWNTKYGRENIKSALKGSPNEKEILNYLRKNELFEASKDMRSMLKNDLNRETIREIGGKEALDFLDNTVKEISEAEKYLNRQSKIFEQLGPKNVSKKELDYRKQIIPRIKAELERKQFPIITKIEDFYGNLSPATKQIFTLMGIYNFPKVTGTIIVMKYLAKNRRIRYFLKNFMKSKGKNPYVQYVNLRLLDEAIKQEAKTSELEE